MSLEVIHAGVSGHPSAISSIQEAMYLGVHIRLQHVYRLQSLYIVHTIHTCVVIVHVQSNLWHRNNGYFSERPWLYIPLVCSSNTGPWTRVSIHWPSIVVDPLLSYFSNLLSDIQSLEASFNPLGFNLCQML